MFNDNGTRATTTPRILCLSLLWIIGCQGEPSPVAQPDADVSASTALSDAKPDVGTKLDIGRIREAGLAALESGDLDKADELARTAIAAMPEDPGNVFLMSFALAEQNRFYEAIDMLDDLAERVPATRTHAIVQKAEWMVLQGRWREAEEHCHGVLDELPDSVPIHRLLVQLYTRQGRRLDAARHLRMLCRIGDIEEQELHALLATFYSFDFIANIQEFEPIGELGTTHYAISAGGWEVAEERLRQLSDKNPAELALLGRVLAHQEKFDQLDQWANEIPESAKVTSDYWFAMGAYHAQQGDHVEAIKSFCAAVVRDESDQQAYTWLSRSLEAINADPQAKEAAQRAELIRQTQTISAQLLSATPQRDLSQISELVDLLGQLRRPLEALAWRKLLLMYGRASVSQVQAAQMMEEINRNRSQLLQQNQAVAPRSFVLCGVNLEVLKKAESSTMDPGDE